MSRLTTTDHNRESVGLTYVYPVISRRSGGLSIGINLNPNSACNWQCIYCQVPGLQRGNAPKIDLDKLEEELLAFLEDVLHGNFYDRFDIALQHRLIRDIALSGNGEPTSAKEFPDVIDLVGRAINKATVSEQCKKVLITNGSLVGHRSVQEGLKRLNDIGGEIWFKVDRATEKGLKVINHAAISVTRMTENLITAANLCPTWVQSCFFAIDGEPPAEEEVQAYLDLLKKMQNQKVPLKGILLYGLARPSLQPEADRLSPLGAVWIEKLAERVVLTGYPVKVN